MNTQSSIQFVPLNRLLASQHNVRRTDRKADIAALAASIAAHGLLQNLTVTPAALDKFEVVAGARRLAALKSLAKAGSIARDFAVPCQVIKPEGASEASLVENVHRVAMNVMDEVEAYSALTGSGLSVDDVARRFGCANRHVEQRLALAALSPKLKSAYRRADLSLDAARAFCIEPDHSKQEAVFKSMNKPVNHAASVRSHLTQGRMKSSDRLAKFVGLEAYELAGGGLTRDLFDDGAVFVNEPALMSRLADERLESIRSNFLSAGWGWVNINLGTGGVVGGSRRIYPTRRPLSEAEQQMLDEMDHILAGYDDTLEDAEEDDPRWGDRDVLAQNRQDFIDAFQEWDRELIGHAGIVISLDYDGHQSFSFGIVTKADEAALKKILVAREKSKEAPGATLPDDSGDDGAASDAKRPPWEEESGQQYRKSLVLELTAARARTLRLEVSINPDIALALTVFALARQSLSGYFAAGVEIQATHVTVADDPTLEQSRVLLNDILPAEAETQLDWLLGQERNVLLHILAVITASALDLVHSGVEYNDRQKQAFADRLASYVNLDMTKHWKADLDFWSGLSKAQLLNALEEAPAMAAMTDEDRIKFIKAHAKMKRDDLAQAVAQLLDGANWLPDLLVTPVRESSFELTDSGYAAIAAE